MNSRKYPRTSQEAFGPYTSREIDDAPPWQPADLITNAACVLAVLAVVGFVALGWIV